MGCTFKPECSGKAPLKMGDLSKDIAGGRIPVREAANEDPALGIWCLAWQQESQQRCGPVTQTTVKNVPLC